MSERLPPHAEDLARRFLAVCDELDPLIAEDADGATVEWWIRIEQVCGRMSDAARLVARALGEEGPGDG